MNQVYFFKVKTRIGLQKPPLYSKELSLGVEDGPDAILTKDFLQEFPKSVVKEFIFPKPSAIPKEQFSQVLASTFRVFKTFVNESLPSDSKQKLMPIGIGGDHSLVLGSIMACLDRGINPKEIGIIHIDSHGDINLSKDSPTGNFHGMYLRPLFDSFDIPEIDDLVPTKIPIQNLFMIGNLDLDPGEKLFLTQNQVPMLFRQDIQSNSNLPKVFKEFTKKYKHLHISFDIDVLDGSIAPGTGIPAKKGFLIEELTPFLKIIKNHPSFSFDLCEVNPTKDKNFKTIKSAQKILEIILS